MARHRVKRAAEPRRHMRDKAGLAAACRSLEQDRQAVVIGVLENLALRAVRRVERQIALLHRGIDALQHAIVLRGFEAVTSRFVAAC